MNPVHALDIHPSGLYLTFPGFPGAEGWFAGFTTLRACGSLEPVLPFLGLEGLPVFRPRQVHGRRVFRIDAREEPGSLREEGDGLATGRRGIVLAVGAADCVPLLLFDPRARAGAAIHAGWRGTLAAIAREGVETLCREWGSRPGDLRALIGPSIGPCCYEVGPEVAGAFRRAGFPGEILVSRDGGPERLDLTAANRRLLQDSGVPPGQIEAAGLCTCCRGDLFPSYRREGSRAGRFLGFLGSAPFP